MPSSRKLNARQSTLSFRVGATKICDSFCCNSQRSKGASYLKVLRVFKGSIFEITAIVTAVETGGKSVFKPNMSHELMVLWPYCMSCSNKIEEQE